MMLIREEFLGLIVWDERDVGLGLLEMDLWVERRGGEDCWMGL